MDDVMGGGLWLALAAGLLLIVILWLVSGEKGRMADDREPYWRDNRGNIWALMIGPGTLHERYIHVGGTPHQNPAVRAETRWWLIFPYSVDVAYYPLTVNGRLTPDVDAIQAAVDAGRAIGDDVALVTLDVALEREVIVRENGGQLDRGVPASALTHTIRGGRR